MRNYGEIIKLLTSWHDFNWCHKCNTFWGYVINAYTWQIINDISLLWSFNYH